MKTVSVEEIGRARERRVETHRELLNEFNKPIISFTLNIPGAVKDRDDFRKIHEIGVKLINRFFNDLIVYEKLYQGKTGSEAYFVINSEEQYVKEKTVDIENNHHFGRLFDMDVISQNGSSLTRVELGYPLRKCLICDEYAPVCRRLGSHSAQELSDEISRIIRKINT